MKSQSAAFARAVERYAALGVDVRAALQTLRGVSLSIQCWQGDDVGGFESSGAALGGGLAVTGSYPGKARSPQELRADLEKALSLIPGRHRLNLHASYGEFGRRPADRDAISAEHFKGWMAWAAERKLGLDFNPTFFAHPKAADGFTLSHPNRAIREFWIEHGRRCREIGAALGKFLGTPCVTNVWIPDGFKDTPVDRAAPRQRLAAALDAVFARPLAPRFNLDAVEPKLFGLGTESYVVGSHEFYLGYAITRKKLLCLDSGHYHPTEGIADKLSSVLQYLPALLLHVSRGVRWDSDHVVTWSDELQAIAHELIAQDYLPRVHLGLDYFDASINRVAAWVLGSRNVLRALLLALLEPLRLLRAAEESGDYTTRLALQEESKSLPHGVVWDHYCETQGVPVAEQWLQEVKRYEASVLSKRS